MMPLRTTLSRAARSWLKPTPSSMNVERRPSIQIWPLSTPVDAGEALQERALAAAVAPGDPEEFAAVDLEGDVIQRRERLVAGAAQRMQRCLLERVRALLGDAKGLADRASDDRRGAVAGQLWHGGRVSVGPGGLGLWSSSRTAKRLSLTEPSACSKFLFDLTYLLVVSPRSITRSTRKPACSDAPRALRSAAVRGR